MCTSLDVANYFLSLTETDAGDAITNLKMQKLVYYAQGFALALLDRPLFNEDIEAWTHGPVVPALYHALKCNGDKALETIPNTFSLDKFNEEEKDLLDQVYTQYGQFSAWRLRDMTHNEPPWRDTPQGSVISKEKLKSYFGTLIE